MGTILPNGEMIHVTPEEILRYLNPDGLRQLMRQERLRWNLKPNTDIDYMDNQLLFKYTGELHNTRFYQKMETRTFPDNGAYPGYAGIYTDSGIYGIIHNLEKWDKCLSEESKKAIVNRTMLGAMATIEDKKGFGLDDSHEMVTNTNNRIAAILFDPWDGRAYLYSNDDPTYVNNENRQPDERLPERSIARIGDIPTRLTQLKNDLDFVSDHDYHHTDNNFTNSHRFILDNIDDRTFVYPEISKDASGDYVENYRVGLSGDEVYGESDGEFQVNSQPDIANGDRAGEAINSYNHNKNHSGVTHKSGYLPGIFRSVEELERVDLIDQRMTPRTHLATPGAKRVTNYYVLDGKWGANWFDRYKINDSFLSQSLNPSNMEISVIDTEPTPYAHLKQNPLSPQYDTSKLYQWRYNRIEIKYKSSDITISIVESGEQYRVNDKLRWTFGDDVFLYTVDQVGPNGQIQKGHYTPSRDREYEQDPSTHGVGIPFTNMTSVGRGATLSVSAKATIETHATQIKNNLYAYVDITPTVRSDNSTEWSDTHMPDSQDGKIAIRSTAAGPAYSGINSGRGGPIPNSSSSSATFYEHGGNATAGVHVHLFRYVIDTQNPRWVVRDGIQIFLGQWVDQGPMGIERPCDIKALLFSNPDTNNFNNYYKFMMDVMVDNLIRNPDGVATNNKNAVSHPYFHIDQCDPASDQRFTEWRFNPDTYQMEEVDITDRVLYINGATGIMWYYNATYKNDPSFGYGLRKPGWMPISGAVSK